MTPTAAGVAPPYAIHHQPGGLLPTIIAPPPPPPTGKATQVPKFKKAPDAPKRFKSAFIIFSAEKHKEIKENFAKQGRAEKVSVFVCQLGL